MPDVPHLDYNEAEVDLVDSMALQQNHMENILYIDFIKTIKRFCPGLNCTVLRLTKTFGLHDPGAHVSCMSLKTFCPALLDQNRRYCLTSAIPLTLWPPEVSTKLKPITNPFELAGAGCLRCLKPNTWVRRTLWLPSSIQRWKDKYTRIYYLKRAQRWAHLGHGFH